VNPFSFETGFLGVKSVFELILSIFLFVNRRFSVENREIDQSTFSTFSLAQVCVCVSFFSVLFFAALPRFRSAFPHCSSERCRAFAARFRTVLQSAAALSQRVSALFFRALPRFRSAFPHCSSERFMLC
jgi:hypothetical protein